MTNDETGEAAARTTLKGVHIDTLTRKSCPFTAAILESARARARPSPTAGQGSAA
jgi:acyl-CoA thioester hydrolase